MPGWGSTRDEEEKVRKMREEQERREKGAAEMEQQEQGNTKLFTTRIDVV